VPKSNDHAPARTIFLWNVDMGNVTQIVKNSLYKTLKNLKMRLLLQMRQAHALITKSEDAPNSLIQAEKEALDQIRGAQERLENSVLEVDQSLSFVEF
jgi:hypothetical protein